MVWSTIGLSGIAGLLIVAFAFVDLAPLFPI